MTTLETRRIRAARAAACRGRECALITDVTRPSEVTPADLELTFGSLEKALSAGYEVIDIRDDHEVRFTNSEEIAAACPTATLAPFDNLGHRNILFAPPVIRAAVTYLQGR